MPGNTTTTTTQQTPTWYDQLSKSFGDTLAGGVENIGNLNQNWYTDPLVQGMNSLQTGAISGANSADDAWKTQYNNAGNTFKTATGQVTDASNFNPNETSLWMNPYLSGARQATINASNQNLFESVIPKVNSTFAGTGQFGSSRNADFMNRAIDNQQRTLTDSIGNLNYGAQKDAFENQYKWGQLGTQGGQILGGLGQLQQGLGTATSLAGWTDLENQLKFGNVQQQQGQKELDAAYKDWQNQLSVPIDLFSKLASTMPNFTGLYGGNKTTSNLSSTGSLGGLEQFLATLIAGYGSGAKP